MEFDRDDPADFYFKLDCDEFLIVHRNGQYSCSRRILETMLTPYRGMQHVLMFGTGFDNLPGEPGRFVRKGRKKCFFAQDTYKSLDRLSRGTGQAQRRIHARTRRVADPSPHQALLREHAIQKMVGRVNGFDTQTLIAYKEARGRGMHLVDELLLSNEEEYLAVTAKRYEDIQVERLEAFEDALARVGVALPY